MLAGRKLARRAEAQQAEAGARGRIRTRTGDALDVVPLLVGLHEQTSPAGLFHRLMPRNE